MIKVAITLTEDNLKKIEKIVFILTNKSSKKEREMNMKESTKKLSGGSGTTRRARKLILSLFLVFCIPSIFFSQERGGRGGPFIMLNFLNLNSLNEYLTSLGVGPFDDEPAIFWGCEGMSDKKKLTFGGFFVHGSLGEQ